MCAQNLDIVSISALHAFGKQRKEAFLMHQVPCTVLPWNHITGASRLPREIRRNFTEERTVIHRRDSAQPLTVSKRGAGRHTASPLPLRRMPTEAIGHTEGPDVASPPLWAVGRLRGPRRLQREKHTPRRPEGPRAVCALPTPLPGTGPAVGRH